MIRRLRRRYERDGTKILGTAQLMLSGWIAIDGFIPKNVIPYVAAINVALAAFTIRRGYTNTDKADDGQNSGV